MNEGWGPSALTPGLQVISTLVALGNLSRNETFEPLRAQVPKPLTFQTRLISCIHPWSCPKPKAANKHMNKWGRFLTWCQDYYFFFAMTIQWEKRVMFSTNSVGRTGYMHAKERC